MSKSINVPKLRFKEFNGEWEEKQLGKIATFYNSKRIPLTEIDRIKGEYPYYGASGIIDYVKDYIFDGEYILLGEDGANIVMRNSRLAFLAKGKFWVNNHAHIFQAKDSNTFLCEALERINYTKYNTGTAQPKLNSDVVKKIKLLVPLKQEQEKIASFLTSVDTKIEQLTKKEELLQQYKKGVIQKIFNQEIRFKADDGSEFCDWEEKSLNELVEFSNGKAHENDIDESGDYIVVNSKFISSNGTVKKYSNSQIAPLYKNDIVMVMSDVPNGKALSKCYLIDENNKYTLNQRICSLRQTINNNKFLIYLINRNKYYLAFDSGVGQTNLRKDEVLNLKLKVPCLEEQNKIANFLSSIDCKIEQTQKQLESSKEFKKALLQQMFV